MTGSIPDKPIHMVVAYDFSDTSQLAMSRAIALAETEPRHVLHVLSVLDERHDIRPAGKGKVTYDDAMDIQEQLTREIQGRLESEDPSAEIHFFVHVRIGKAADEILALASEVGAHLILAGSHGRTGLERVLMGSVSETVVREAKCPVLIVRDREYEDVELQPVVEAPEDHADGHHYVQPHRYSYINSMMQRQKSSYPWY